MPRILIVDDERAILSLLKIAFTRAGHQVWTAASAREAMDLCKSESFDALLSDVQMPTLNGHELVRWAVRSYPRIRCVLMTGFDDVDCQDCPFTSRCQCLTKPFDPKQAVSLVEQSLRTA